MKELILKEIPIAPNDNYRAGNDGQIYSRTSYKGFGKKVTVDWYPLKGHKTKKGYISVTLCHDNVKVTKNVHRLVCMAFHGMPAKDTLQVRHLDSNPNNNIPENLAWGTQAENWMDRKAAGHGMEGEKHPQSKLTDEERAHIKWIVQKGIASRTHIAKALGMSSTSIISVCAK